MSEFVRCGDCGEIFEDNYDQGGICSTCKMPEVLEQNREMRAVIQELLESAGYWSEYDVPLGIVDRMKEAIK
jgi:hypothetical protein